MPFTKPRFMRLFGSRTTGYGHVERDGDGNVTRTAFGHTLDCHDESCEHVSGRNGKHTKDKAYPRGWRTMVVSLWGLFVAGIVYMAASYAALFRYISLARHEPVIAYSLAGAFDITMMVFILSALALAMQGEGAARAHFCTGCFALLSAAMNYAAAESLPPWYRLAFVAPPVALWIIAGFQAWAIRKFVLKVEGELIPTWRRFAFLGLAFLAFALDPVNQFTAYRRWALRTVNPSQMRPFTVQPSGVITIPEIEVQTVSEIEQPVPAAKAAKPAAALKRADSAANEAKRRRLMEAVALRDPAWMTRSESERSNLAYTVAKEHESDEGWPHHTAARKIVEREYLHAMSNGHGDAS